MRGSLHPNSDTKKSFFKRTWKSMVATLTVLGVVWGVLEGVYFFTQEWHEYEIYKEKVDSEDFNERIIDLEKYVINKRKSFAVGFRVFKHEDEETGKISFVKRYRDWQGTWHEIFRDRETSDLYGVDHYYYIDKETDEKIYCW